MSSRTRARAAIDLRVSLLVGMLMATIYAAYAVGLYLVEGAVPFSKNGTSLGIVLLVYYLAGGIGGAVVGLLMPLTRTLLGVVVVGIVVAFVVFFCIGTASSGPAWRWTPSAWRQLGYLSISFGTAGGVGWRTLVEG